MTLPGYTARRPRKSVPDRIAGVLTYVVNPLILLPITMFLLAVHDGARHGPRMWIVMSSVLFYFILPVFSLVLLRIIGRVETIEVREKDNRFVPLAIGFGLAVIAIPIVRAGAGDMRGLVTGIGACFALNLLFLMLITQRFKISLHSAGATSFTVFLGWFALYVTSPPLASFSISLSVVYATMLLTPLLIWARIQVGAHTLAESLIGAAFGIAAPLTELYFLTVLDLIP